MTLNNSFLQLLQESQIITAAVAVFTIIGALFILSKTLSFLKLIVDVFVLPGKDLKEFGAGQGAWAVVTGASDGIGREYAMQLAAAKFNILMVSRTASKLKALRDEIESKYKVDTRMYAMDFTKGDRMDYSNLRDIIEELDVGVLVNNVATNHEIPTPFYLEDDEIIHNIVEVNIAGLLKVTKIALSKMLPKNRGLIINVGSFSGTIPTPYLSVYSGSKAFMNAWSQAIGAELNSKGILVENVNTYFVVSAMSKIRKPSLLIPLPGPYVKSVLSKIGIPGGASYYPFNSNTYPSHALVNWLITNTLSWSFWVNYTLEGIINETFEQGRVRP
ncbi:27605_t:CDS:2 [Racocetra persica]|uniref:27605_t:CDS:1 n=1 Tax=Racocetra persica TaxID=160502 RepID=A0ACA9MBP2_9GLOM|nr:27605_t:CDS:2 [Racocetra persica]